MEMRESSDSEQDLLILPPHRRCACHLLSLVATTDIECISSSTFKKSARSAMGKLKALFNKQSRSTIAADKFQELLGKFIALSFLFPIAFSQLSRYTRKRLYVST